jgi:hypothetical protein
MENLKNIKAKPISSGVMNSKHDIHLNCGEYIYKIQYNCGPWNMKKVYDDLKLINEEPIKIIKKKYCIIVKFRSKKMFEEIEAYSSEYNLEGRHIEIGNIYDCFTPYTKTFKECEYYEDYDD